MSDREKLGVTVFGIGIILCTLGIAKSWPPWGSALSLAVLLFGMLLYLGDGKHNALDEYAAACTGNIDGIPSEDMEVEDND